ncbi:MAG TPA: caspase family protein, partial [Pyrinomonadaceae bacterium]|nr:caspase family protein [Pyrinomonadaceae bacterium]
MRGHFKAQRSFRWLSVTALLLSAALGTFAPSAQPQRRRDVQTAAPSASPTLNAKRFALVIGNTAYESGPLKNPVNDARAMAEALRACSFDVLERENATQTEMKQTIRTFGERLRSGGPQAIGLFYYAGHGVQVRDRNYLIPVRATVNNEEEIEYEAVDVGFVMAEMEAAENNLNIIILDACRDNPYARSFRSASRGLAQIIAPTSTLIAYATAPGRTASDGLGANGLYTSELLTALRTPGLPIEDVFKQVRIRVREKSGGQQVPWESSSLTEDFYFTPKTGGVEATASPTPLPRLTADESALELSFWETIKNSTDAEDFKAYLERYPNGNFAALAKRRIALLTTSHTPTTS